MARFEGGWGFTYWQKDSFVGTRLDDEIYTHGGDDFAHGGDGDDLIKLGDGNDTGKGGEHDDTIHGENGNDSIEGGGDQDELFGGNGEDTLLGDSGHDTIDGGAGSDRLDGGSGDDVLDGGWGDDTMVGGSGNDVFEDFFGANTMVGGEHVLNRDHDIANYSGLTGRVVINLQTQTATTFERISQGGVEQFNQIGTAVVLEIEDVTGTNFNDSITGDGEANILRGLRGDDTLRGGGGDDEIRGGFHSDVLLGEANNDQLFGDDGNDTLNGGTGNDTLNGGFHDDVLTGGSGNDVFVDVFGNDTINGGEDFLGLDIDTLDYSEFYGFATVDLQSRSATTAQFQFQSDNSYSILQVGSATVAEIENVIGTSRNDKITGDAGRNVLEGGNGSDELNGGGNDDVLIGGRGGDILDGGAGRDAYVIDSRGDNSGIASQAFDIILNFNAVDDTIHLDNAIYAALGVEGRLSAEAFLDRGNSIVPTAQDANDRIILAGNYLYYDADGTGATEALMIARFDRPVGTITADDFLII